MEQLARGEVRAAIDNLDGQRRVHEFSNREERMTAVAREYARSPERTLVVSPDNRSRMEINERIHGELQSRGVVSRDEGAITTLVPRQEMTGADRTWAAQYQVNDILRYSRTSRETGIEKGEYARVTRIDAEKNLLTVARADGRERTYDPRRQMGVTVYREQDRVFSQGDRIQFTAPSQDLKTANRETWHCKGHRSERRHAGQVGQRARNEPQPRPVFAHRSRVCSDEPFQPGADGRSRTHPCGYRSRRQGSAQ